MKYVRSKNQYVYDHPANNIKGDDKMGKQASDKYYGETGLDNMTEICCKTKETSDGKSVSTPSVKCTNKYLQAKDNNDETDVIIDVEDDYEYLVVKEKAFETEKNRLGDVMAVVNDLNK